MCGRYEFSLAEPSLRALWETARQRFPQAQMETGEIFPSELAAVLLGAGDRVQPQPARWGFPGSEGGLVINARAETAASKPMFREALRHSRCAVPVSAYFEWSHDRAHNKYSLRPHGHGVFYLAGLCRDYHDGRRFVILTRPAGRSVADLHDRMPVILTPDEVEDWVSDPERTGYLLTQEAPDLERRSEDYEQQSLF